MLQLNLDEGAPLSEILMLDIFIVIKNIKEKP
jgi:hypothetical protein